MWANPAKGFDLICGSASFQCNAISWLPNGTPSIASCECKQCFLLSMSMYTKILLQIHLKPSFCLESGATVSGSEVCNQEKSVAIASPGI